MSQISVTDLAASDSALRACLACREGREVVMKQEALLALIENVIHNFLVESRSESSGDESLGLAAGEYCRSVRSGQIIDLAPDRADLCGLAAVETDAFVEHATAHSLFLDIMIVTLHHRLALVCVVFFELLLCHLGERLKIFVADLSELLGAPVLVGGACTCYGVSLVVALVMNVLAEFVVVDLVAVCTFFLFAGFFHKLELGHAVLLDFGVSHFECLEKFGFRNLVHLTLDHHDVVVGGADHKFDVSLFDLFESRVDHPLAVDACNANFGNRSVERYVTASQSCRCRDSCECVGGVVFIGRIKSYVYERVCMIIVGEERTEHAVNQT